MIQVIETNLSIDTYNDIKDHQSRVIEITDWDDYVSEIKEAKTVIRSSIIGSMHGTTIPYEAYVENLTYDEKHLSCDIINRFGVRSKKFAYRV